MTRKRHAEHGITIAAKGKFECSVFQRGLILQRTLPWLHLAPMRPALSLSRVSQASLQDHWPDSGHGILLSDACREFGRRRGMVVLSKRHDKNHPCCYRNRISFTLPLQQHSGWYNVSGVRGAASGFRHSQSADILDGQRV